MGTSQSSNGPGADVAMVPPWADELPSADQADQADPGDPADGRVASDREDYGEVPEPTAPPGRFRSTRNNLGRFSRTGDANQLRRGLGHYVSSGYGGTGTLGRRLSGTATSAGRLASVLSSGARPDGTSLRDSVLATAANVDQVMNAIVLAVRPVDGSQDAEAAQSSVRSALGDLLSRYPDADLLALDAAQRSYVIERFVALDVYHRVLLDVGRTITANAPDARTALARQRQLREYISETVAASFRKLTQHQQSATSADIVALTRSVLSDTFDVFQEYLG